MPARVSVVISTYNRALGLRTVLEGLRHQTYEDFEVVVVNGPSTDGTTAVLAEYGDRIRTGECREQSLTRSRNVGISIGSGDVVAFIDDDAIPEPGWIADLVSGYADGSVGGVGGIVYDHTGFRLQYKYSVCSRIGEPGWDVEPPLDRYLVPGSDPFLYLQGTNQSYLRRHLARVGGFNECLEHYYDDVEISMQLIDAGHRLLALPSAGVHHKYMASSVRNHQRVLIDPYRIIKDRFCFALTACRERSRASVTDVFVRWAETMRDAGRGQRDAGQLTGEQFEHYRRRVDEAVTVALDGAASLERPRRPIRDADEAAFRRYPTVRAEGKRLTVCLLSKEYPPDDFGGVGRLTADFANEFAARGHEVHVVAESPDVGRVDFEHGVWVHRLDIGGSVIDELADVPAGPNLALVASMYREVCRIHERGAVDVVVAALWLAQGVLCSLDPRFATVLLLESGTRTIADFHPSWASSPNIQQLISLEGALFRRAAYLHAISRDILRVVQQQYGRTYTDAFVIPLGRRDHRGEVRRRRGENKRLRVLFVSRLERRKGVDVLLPVIARLVRKYAHVDFVLAGKDTENTELGETYTAVFRREFAGDPEVMSRVTFTGWLSDEALMQAYADADVFCLPARYESLGLVVIEAMAFGLPVVASGVGGLVEIVEPERSGLLVPVEDEVALEAALGRLVEDEALRRRLGERSRRLFEEKFDLAVTVPRTLEALQRVAAEHGAARGHRCIGTEEAAREVGRRLPEVVAEVIGDRGERARAISAALLDDAWHTPNVIESLKRLWPLPDEEFVLGMYPLFLGRKADPAGLRDWVAALRSGRARLDVVRALTMSEEATAQKLDLTWLASLPSALGLSAAAAVPQPTRRVSARLRAVMARMPSYLLNAAYLPTNIRELRKESAASRASQERLERGLRDHAARLLRVERAVSEELLQKTEDALAGSATLLQQTAELARAQEAQGVSLRQQLEAQAQGVQQVSGGLQMLSEWVSLLQKKMEMLALDLRERVATRREADDLPDPRVADPDGLWRKIDSMGGRIRVNLGCGEKPLEGFVNVDFREAPHVDIVADARRLPFEESTLAEIFSSHLVEHFRRHHFATSVLPYWRRLLLPGGLLRTVCPNWQEMLRRLHDGEMRLEDFTVVTFGAQDYCGDDHFSMYTPQTLGALLESSGFESIEVVAEARQNGLCPEMEILAVRKG